MTDLFSIENRLVQTFPSPQNALDIFKDRWISKLPEKFSCYTAGFLPLFEDTRISDSTKILGPIKDKRVLDLGPLEGGQAYILEKLEAAQVISIEANTISYLKCLVLKEILQLHTKFLCGDVVEFLKTIGSSPTIFDLCVACGILYHMTNPVELLYYLSYINEIIIWTHYFDDIDDTRNIIKFKGSEVIDFHQYELNCTYHRQEYGSGFNNSTYCGGTQNYSNWISKGDLVKILTKFGFKVTILSDSNTVNGPAMLLTGQHIS